MVPSLFVIKYLRVLINYLFILNTFEGMDTFVGTILLIEYLPDIIFMKQQYLLILDIAIIIILQRSNRSSVRVMMVWCNRSSCG